MTDYKVLYEEKCGEIDELTLQMESDTNDMMKMIDELEKENSDLRNKKQIM